MQSNVKYHRPMKECLECTMLFKERGDKKFCSTKCKNTYHNREAREREAPYKEKNKVLKRNYQILRKLWCSDFYTEGVPKKVLVYEGFDFTAFTGLTKNEKTKAKITWVYNLGLESSKAADLFFLCIWGVDGPEAPTN